MKALVQSRVPLADLWFVATALYGIEYLLRPRVSTSPVLNVLEGAAPFWVWGCMLITPSVIGLFADRMKWWGTAVWMHGCCFAVFCGLLYGIVAGVAAANQAWGWALGIGYALLITLHGLWAIVDVLRDRARELAIQRATKWMSTSP